MNSRILLNAFKDHETKDPAANCIFVGNGQLHLVSFLAFYLDAKAHDVDLSGVVCNCGTGGRKHYDAQMVEVLFGDRFSYIEEDAATSTRALLHEIVEVPKLFVASRGSSTRGGSRDVWSIENALYVCFPMTGNPPLYLLIAAFKLKRPIVYVQLEEGTGSYGLSVYEWRRLGLKRASSFMKKLSIALYSLSMYPVDWYIDHVLMKRMSVISFTLFRRNERGALIEDPHAASKTAEAFSRVSVAKGIIPEDFSNTVVIASTNFDAFDEFDFEMLALKDCIRIAQRLGFDVVIRPHPNTVSASMYDSLGVSIDRRTDVSLESQISVAIGKPLAVLGFTSSCQVFSHALWNIPNFALNGVFSDELEKLARCNSGIAQFNDYCARTLTCFPSSMESPQDIDELEEALRGLKQL